MTGITTDNKLKKRVLSGLVLGPLTVFVMFSGGWIFALLLVAAFCLAVYEWHSMAARGGRYFLDMTIGLFYLPVSFLSFYALREWFPYGEFMATALFIAVSASDTGAYFAGTILKGPKMAPSLSPNKTWAGFGGAMVSGGLAMAACILASKMFTDGIDTGLASMLAWFFVGTVSGVVGQAGDLSISAFKRRVAIKDTGNIIPGHGGLLDRIDSLLLVSPVFTLFMALG